MNSSPTPAALGYFIPPEWAPQTAIWLSWFPRNPELWEGGKDDVIHAKFAEIAAVISRFEPVRINAAPDRHALIHDWLEKTDAARERIELFEHPNNDVWCRDHGPIFLKHRQTGELALTDWEFNSWGEKFPPWNLDNEIPRRIAQSLALPCFDGGMILEGGAIEVNGAGQLLTTESVLLNPNRNSKMSRAEIEQRLRDFLGVTEILWLHSGIEGDDTDGHIDDLARFIDDRTILASIEPDPASPNHDVLAENLDRLQHFATIESKPFEVIKMPMPQACEVPGWRLPILPASYVNYLLVNGGVLVPTFRQPGNDDHALGLLRELFPDRDVIGIDCLDLVEEAGSLHCLSQQQPA